MMTLLIHSDARFIPLAAESVHMVVTSPPYYSLRDYGTSKWEGGDPTCDHIADPNKTKHFGNEEFNVNRPSRDNTKVKGYYYKDVCGKCGAIRIDKQIGLEKTAEEYVATIRGVFREVWRVLRPDGTVWLNLGDSMAGSGGAGGDYNEGGLREGQPKYGRREAYGKIKAKDMFGIPWTVALALRDDGWYLRSDIIWHKTNPMPESVTDRPTHSHEYVFLFSKNEQYFYDIDAVREPHEWADKDARSEKRRVLKQSGKTASDDNQYSMSATGYHPNGRNRRDVWTISTAPYPGAHYATYPPDLVRPCIKAGTSEKGCCPHCGAPIVRVTERVGANKSNEEGIAAMIAKGVPRQKANLYVTHERGTTRTIDWEQSCTCKFETPAPCKVLDPFVGSGTTLLVARELGREGIGLDLSYEYLVKDARTRLELDKLESWGSERGRDSSQDLSGLPMFDTVNNE